MSGPIVANTTYKQVPSHAPMPGVPRPKKSYWPKFTNISGKSWYYAAYPNITNFRDHATQYNSAVHWIKENVDDWENNAMWKKVGDCFYIKLQHERDAIMFTLTFGKGSNDFQSV